MASGHQLLAKRSILDVLQGSEYASGFCIAPQIAYRQWYWRGFIKSQIYSKLPLILNTSKDFPPHGLYIDGESFQGFYLFELFLFKY